MNDNISKEIQAQALKVAKGTQKKGQNKEQTKLIAQGIEKGIAEYKKQQNIKARERDKQRKQQLKKQQTVVAQTTPQVVANENNKITNALPWLLLLISWLAFAYYLT